MEGAYTQARVGGRQLEWGVPTASPGAGCPSPRHSPALLIPEHPACPPSLRLAGSVKAGWAGAWDPGAHTLLFPGGQGKVCRGDEGRRPRAGGAPKITDKKQKRDLSLRRESIRRLPLAGRILARLQRVGPSPSSGRPRTHAALRAWLAGGHADPVQGCSWRLRLQAFRRLYSWLKVYWSILVTS